MGLIFYLVPGRRLHCIQNWNVNNIRSCIFTSCGDDYCTDYNICTKQYLEGPFTNNVSIAFQVGWNINESIIVLGLQKFLVWKKSMSPLTLFYKHGTLEFYFFGSEVFKLLPERKIKQILDSESIGSSLGIQWELIWAWVWEFRAVLDNRY